jgi:hypothetical protein
MSPVFGRATMRASIGQRWGEHAKNLDPGAAIDQGCVAPRPPTPCSLSTLGTRTSFASRGGPLSPVVGSDGNAIPHRAREGGRRPEGSSDRWPRTRSKGAQDALRQCFGTDSRLTHRCCDRSLGLCGREGPLQTGYAHRFLDWGSSPWTRQLRGSSAAFSWVSCSSRFTSRSGPTSVSLN